ncbi:MAG: trimeric intracellular cation channel family protein [Lentisphaeria bacterium]|nr:trimeric intracellular cation channel family protein [Lentisphaeria bacterium]
MEPSVIIQTLDLAGTCIFAVTGAVKGVRKHLDIFGVTVLACCVGVGGGIIRDAVIGRFPVSALANENYILISIVSGLVTFGTAKHWMRIRSFLQIGDAAGLGIFTALGAQRAFEAGLGPTGIILCGVITAIGGGVIRDVLTGTVPVVLKSDFYATASMIGAMIFCFMLKSDPPFPLLFIVSAGTVTVLRLLALHYNVQLPAAGYLTRRHRRRQEKG